MVVNALIRIVVAIGLLNACSCLDKKVEFHPLHELVGETFFPENLNNSNVEIALKSNPKCPYMLKLFLNNHLFQSIQINENTDTVIYNSDWYQDSLKIDIDDISCVEVDALVSVILR